MRFSPLVASANSTPGRASTLTVATPALAKRTTNLQRGLDRRVQAILSTRTEGIRDEEPRRPRRLHLRVAPRVSEQRRSSRVVSSPVRTEFRRARGKDLRNVSG